MVNDLNQPKMSESRALAFEQISDERQWGIIYEYIMSKMLRHRKGEDVPPGRLGAYLEEKLDKHQEPSREGTPRGEKIGFPRKKYLASILLGITNRKLKEVAEACGVSYGLLRKWRTETDFQEGCENHRHDFVIKIVERIKEEISIGEKLFDDYFNDRGPDPLAPAAEKRLDRYERILIDTKQFKQEVINELNAEVYRIADVSGDDTAKDKIDRIMLFNRIANVILFAEGNDTLKPDPACLKHLASESRNLLEQNTLSENEKKIILTSLKIFERHFAGQIS